MAYNVTLLNSRLRESLKVKTGIVYSEELNEKRDSGLLVVRTHGEELDLEPFDYILIEGECGGEEITPKLMLIKSYKEEIVSFTTRIDREYTIELMSQTKELERVTLPNLSITELPGGNHRVVYYYIEKFLEAYAPVIKIDDTSSTPKRFKYATKWEIDANLRNRFANVECPEFSWNRPTLSEVLTDLMLVDNCLPCIRDNVLTFLDIGKKGEETDKSRITRAVSQMDSEDYNADLAITMQNAIGTNPARLVEYISLRNQSDGILTTNNMQIVTSKPIYSIKKVTMFVKSRVYRENSFGQQTNLGFRLTGMDITESIKEQSEFDVLDPTPKSINNDFDSSVYKCFNVHYKRGGNTIEGWGTTYGYPFSFSINGQEAVIVGLYVHYKGDRYSYDIEQGPVNLEAYNVDLRDIFFEVEYESMGEVALKVGRRLPLRNALTSSFDNQGSSYVSVQQQSLFEYAKANRLSNKIWELSGFYLTEADVPKCGQTFYGAIIFSRELQYFDDFIKFHAYATADYVLSNYFVSVRAKRRSWAIASGSEALTRHDVNKVFLEFSYREKEDRPRNGMNVEQEAVEFLSPFLYFPNDDTIKGCLFRAYDGSSYYPSSSAYIGVDYTVEAAGLSLAMTFEFSDNYQAGVRVELKDGQYVNRLVPYCDAAGEFVSASVYFDRYVDPADGEFIWGTNYVEKDGTIRLEANPSFRSGDIDDRIEKARNKPIVGGNYRMQNVGAFSGNLNLQKDNREIISGTFQYEYCTDDPNLIVTEAFVRLLRVFHSTQENPGETYAIASEYVLTTLPTAEERYQHVGFLFRDSNSQYKWAHSAYDEDEGAWIWAYEDAGPGNAYRYLNGYQENASKEEDTLAGLFRYIKILYLTSTGVLVPYTERNLTVALQSGRFPNNPKKMSDSSPSGGYAIHFGPGVVVVSGSHFTFSNDVKDDILIGVKEFGVKSVGIADADSGDVLFAINFPEGVEELTDEQIDALSVVYLNVLTTRDYRVSKNVSEQQTYLGTMTAWERPGSVLRASPRQIAGAPGKAVYKATGEKIEAVEEIEPIGFDDAE